MINYVVNFIINYVVEVCKDGVISFHTTWNSAILHDIKQCV